VDVQLGISAYECYAHLPSFFGFYGKFRSWFLIYMRSITAILLVSLIPFITGCADYTEPASLSSQTEVIKAPELRIFNKAGIRTVHVFVALCDNKYQGIIPVGKAIGNGQDPDNNLYWGCDYGVRTYFKKRNSDWVLLQTQKELSGRVLERLLFKHKTENVYLLADAYDGKYIKETITEFLRASAGAECEQVIYQKDTLYFGGDAQLTSYIGHDGLMDFSLPVAAQSNDTSERQAIILSCYSRYYFAPHLKSTGASPLVWTTGLMAPEAYTLHDALHEWVQNKTSEEIRLAAAKAYSRFQKCSLKAAKGLLVTGWESF
jgi:hypothetical protein